MLLVPGGGANTTAILVVFKLKVKFKVKSDNTQHRQYVNLQFSTYNNKSKTCDIHA